MSLINDALKRAKRAQQKQSPPTPVAPLRPVVATRSATVGPSLVLPIFLAATLLLVGGILILFAVSRIFHPPPVADRPIAVNPIATISPPGDSKPDTASAPKPTISPILTNAPTPVPVAPLGQLPPLQPAAADITRSNVPVPAVGEGSNVVTAALSNAASSLPKLQGIVFNPARPTAFLNGKSVLVGGRVGEFRVVGITSQAVTIERAGQTNVLRLEE